VIYSPKYNFGVSKPGEKRKKTAQKSKFGSKSEIFAFFDEKRPFFSSNISDLSIGPPQDLYGGHMWSGGDACT
jgi:hypothetical protein